MMTRRAGVSCARPACIPNSTTNRADRTPSRRNFIGSSLAQAATSAPSGRAGRLEFARDTIDVGRVRAGYGRGGRGVQYIIDLFLMRFRDKRMDLKRLRTFVTV